MATDQSINGNTNYNRWVKWSLLPFLGDALSWLTGTATTRDVNSIKHRVNQLIETQSMQQETMVHILPILNVTWYAAHVNGQHINILMDRVDEMVQDVNNLYNLTTSLATSLSNYELLLHIRSVLTILQDSLSYMKSFLMHIMDYINTTTTGTLSPHILPIADLKEMLSHIEESLPTTMHLPVSSKDALQFYRYLCTHVLIANRHFLLLIDVPIQNWRQQILIYRMFTLDIPHGNFTACYDVDTKYLRITRDETMAVEILDKQYSMCKKANGQFCNIYTPFQPLANPPSCTTALYSKTSANIATRCSLKIRKAHTVSIPTSIAPNVWLITSLQSMVQTGITLVCPEGTTILITLWKPFHNLWLSPTCSATSPYFYLQPYNEPTSATPNISLEIASLHMINTSALDFCIWQHLGNHQTETQLQCLASIPSVPVDKLYKHTNSGITPITPFTSPVESTEDTVSIWTLFSHTGVYVMTIGLLIPAGLGIFCCYFFWCWPARLVCWLLQPGTTQYTIVDYDVEAANVMTGPNSPQDLAKIMACVWSKYLHRWRVNRSNRHSH